MNLSASALGGLTGRRPGLFQWSCNDALSCLRLRSGIVVAGCASTNASRAPTAVAANAESEVRAAAAEFVSAFNGLDQQRFDALWAEDVTVFFPQPPFPIRRIEGKAEVLAWFKRLMDSQRAAGRSPGVDPIDLQVQMAGPDGAIVSFHLGSDPASVARRTLVYRREAAGWRIVHLHGSALTVPQR